jgi:hypothetical protein
LIFLYLKPLQEAPCRQPELAELSAEPPSLYPASWIISPIGRITLPWPKWAKENTPKEAVIACRKPELFHLYADRYTCYFPFEKDLDKFIDGLKKEKVTHVVVDQLGFRQTGDYLVAALNARPHHFKVLQQLTDPDSWLLEFIPDAVAPAVPAPGK